MSAPRRSPRRRWLGLPPCIALGFGVALASLVAAGVASYVAFAERAAASRLVRHTAEARLAQKEVEAALLVSRTALEAYLSGGEPRHRERHLAALAKVQPAIETLERLVEQHPEERPRVAALVEDMAELRAEQAQLLALVDAGDVGAARGLEERGAGRQAFERTALALARLEADERGAHEERETAWSRSVLVSHGVVVAALFVLLCLALAGARLVRDEVGRRQAEADARARALAVQRRIMAVVSHDLRNPLTGVLAAGWALSRTDLPARASSLARRVVDAGTRMERLIRDLLDWSRLHGGAAIPICARGADLADVCRRAAEELPESGGGRIHVEQEGDTSAAFDPERMEQVVGNLLSNALRHGLPATPIRVRAVGTPQELRVEVENEGPAIPVEARAEIFEPFRQGPDGRGAGVGLGLFIVRALAEAHGGAVELHCAAGKTTFTVISSAACSW